MLYLVCMAFRLCLEQHCECTCYSTSWAVMLYSFNVLGCASRWSDIYGMVVYALLMVVPAKLWWLDDRRSGQDWAIGQEMTAVDCQQIYVCHSERDAFNIFRCSALHRLYLIWVHMQNKGITCSELFSFLFIYFAFLNLDQPRKKKTWTKVVNPLHNSMHFKLFCCLHQNHADIKIIQEG